MMMLLLACHAPVWTESAALAEHRARQDLDHDGRVDAGEYNKTLWNGPPFASADADGDGDLSVDEWVALVRGQSPSAFDGPSGEEPVKQAGAAVVAPPVNQQHLAELLFWMGDTLVAAGQPGPAPAAVTLAVQTGRLDSAETRVVLDSLRPPWLAQGWVWPVGVP